MKSNPPCVGRAQLFEPYTLSGESLSERSQRLSAAREVCLRCPLLNKAECIIIAKRQELTRGVWGGIIMTNANREEAKIDVRLR